MFFYGLFIPTSQAAAKRSQHANPTYRNILCGFGHSVATCCDMLGVVGSDLTIFKLEPTTPNLSQHVCCDRLAGASELLVPHFFFQLL